MRWLALCLCFAFPAHAQSPEAAAGEAIDRLEAAQVQLAAARTRNDRVRALTETILAYEDGLAALRDGLRQVAVQEAVLRGDMDARRGELADLLGALQMLGRVPAPVVQSHPDGALAAARAGGVMADLTPALESRIAVLREELAMLDRLGETRQRALDTLQDALENAQEARSALGQAVSDRTDLPLRFEEDPVQTALLLASAESLDGFAAGLAGSLPETTVALSPEGNLPLPVAGYVLPDDGSGRDGVRIATEAQALVTTPVAATLLYRGPLLDYGQVAILEPAADMLFVFAGLQATYGVAGEILPAGAPIGLMGGDVTENDGNLSEISGFDGAERSQTLYLEVRDGQSPVNPDAWFALE
ncbi:murein hydrolase activator EnvC family protein [Yoonia sp. 2307UL14-13]|uniref:murein hydrolase activator EnvC family protein n=1 Tax=Yoonia sp. 2307UL14-13 TaxID=3126506 RepID=UPI0030B495BB